MMALKHAIALLLAASLLPLAAMASEPYPELKRNPFDRPEAETARSDAAVSPPVAPASEDPELRAVLLAGPRSVVNFGGITLQIGESANGYRLLAVDESSATFRKDGKTVVFSLFEPDEADEQ